VSTKPWADPIDAALKDTSAELATGAVYLRDALALARDPQALYRKLPDEARRLLNLTFYERLYLDLKGDTEADLREPFREIHDAAASTTGRLRRPRPGHGKHKGAPDEPERLRPEPTHPPCPACMRPRVGVRRFWWS